MRYKTEITCRYFIAECGNSRRMVKDTCDRSLGYYLLDQARGGDKCSFSDDPRESYDD